jgi:hypothetical protein
MARSTVSLTRGANPNATARSVGSLLAAALASSLIIAIAVLFLNAQQDGGAVGLVDPGLRGPSVAAIRHDFPDAHLPDIVGHDGQQFYAIARQPMHPAAAARDLDRPRYRLQRILLPVLAWALHPGGGGAGLAIALWLVAWLGAVAVGFGGARVLEDLGANHTQAVRAALLLPAVPGVLGSVGLAVPDALALGLALLAIDADLRGRFRSAVALGVLAVLAKESLLLVLLGWVVWRGVRACWLVLAPALVAAGWWLALRLMLPGTPNASHEFEPIVGLLRSLHRWVGARADAAAAVVVLGSLVLGALALVRAGTRSPLAAAIAIQMLFLLCLSPDVLSLNWNATRATLPLTVLAAIALAAIEVRRREPAPVR